MAKELFRTQLQKGSLIDAVHGLTGTMSNSSLVRTDKGFMFKGNSSNTASIDWGNTAPDLINLGTSDFSISFYAKFKGELGSNYRVIHNDNNSIGFRIFIHDGDGFLRIGIGDTALQYQTISDISVLDDKFHHYLILFDRDGDITTYIDGVLQAATFDISGESGTFNHNGTLSIGDSALSIDQYMYVGDLVIYNGLLTSQERAHAYSQFLHAYPRQYETNPRLNINEYKPTDLSHLVDSRIGIPEADAGTELLINGDFDGDTSWTSLGDSSIVNGQLVFGDDDITYQENVPITAGKTVILEYDVVTSVGTLELRGSGDTYIVSNDTIIPNGVGKNYFIVTSIVDNPRVGVKNNGGGTILESISITEWDGEELIPDEDYGFVANDADTWIAIDNNIVEQDGDYVKITYVDDVKGASIVFRSDSSKTIFNSMVTGNKYKIVVEAYVNSGSSVPISMYNGSSYENKATVTNTSPQVFEFDYTHGTGNPLLNTYAGLGGGEFIWIRILSIKKVTGLVAAYNMIPNGDTLVDISGNGYNGTIYNCSSTFEGMLTANRISSYITIPVPIGTFSQTVALTVKPYEDGTIFDSNGDTRTYIRWTEASGYTCSKGNPQVNITYSGSGKGVLATVILPFDNSGIFKMYFDGELVDTDSYTVGVSTTTGRIGCHPSGGNYGKHEVLDLRIYNYVFDDQQAKDYHNSFVKPVLVEDFSNYPVGQTI